MTMNPLIYAAVTNIFNNRLPNKCCANFLSTHQATLDRLCWMQNLRILLDSIVASSIRFDDFVPKQRLLTFKPLRTWNAIQFVNKFHTILLIKLDVCVDSILCTSYTDQTTELTDCPNWWRFYVITLLCNISYFFPSSDFVYFVSCTEKKIEIVYAKQCDCRNV